MALTVKIRADASHFKKTIAGIEVQASGLTGVMGKLGSSIPVMGAALTAAAVAATALGAGLAFIKSASGAASGMETLQVQFEVLTKSASKAKDLIAQFREEAIKSPLSVTDYAQAAQKMLTVGTSAEKVLPTLKMIGDVSLGNGLKFERLALAYSQVISKGRLMGQENNQLAESGFAPLAFIADRTGESMKELMDRMEAQAISSGEVTQAFKDATSAGGLFFGALEKGATTTEGKIAKFNDAILGLKVSFGTGFNEGLKSALDATNEFLPRLEGKFAAAGSRLGVALKKASRGNIDAFVEIGILIGEAVSKGFQDVAGNAITEMLRGLAIKQGLKAGDSPERVKAVTDNYFGPKRRIQERAMDIGDELRGSMGRVMDATEQDSWKIVLRRQIEQTDRQIALQKEGNTELKKIANGSPKPQTSR